MFRGRTRALILASPPDPACLGQTPSLVSSMFDVPLSNRWNDPSGVVDRRVLRVHRERGGQAASTHGVHGSAQDGLAALRSDAGDANGNAARHVDIQRGDSCCKRIGDSFRNMPNRNMPCLMRYVLAFARLMDVVGGLC